MKTVHFVYTDRSHLKKIVSISQTTNVVLSDQNCMKFNELLNCMNSVRGSTYRDYFLRWLLSVYAFIELNLVSD